MALCTFCGEEILPDAGRCPLCLKEAPVVRGPHPASAPAASLVPTLAEAGDAALDTAEDSVYEIPGAETEIPNEWQRGATYELELTARCPYCREPIRTVRVLRLRRTQVTFTSTLPRGGRAITCPACDRILSVELTAL
jgi:hypothetical protein